jgi:hypothetical protein
MITVDGAGVGNVREVGVVGVVGDWDNAADVIGALWPRL